MSLPIEFPMPKIIELCEKYRVRRMSVFGAILGDHFGPDCLINFLVEFEPTHSGSILRMQDELASVMGRPVDLNTPKSLNHYVRENVMADAMTIYLAPWKPPGKPAPPTA